MVGAIVCGDSMHHFFRTLVISGLLVTIALPNAAFAADPEPMDKRVERLEKELRAVQRKVFPGGAPVQPDITAPEAAAVAPPTSTPVTDLLARVSSLESQIATLTGQIEQNSFKLRQLEEKVNRMVAEATPPAVDGGAAGAAPGPAASTSGAAAAPTAAKPAPRSAPASDARKAAVAAIELPDTGNPAKDAYSYGYRLWEAKFYPEAQVQLKTAVEKYGDGPFGSRAQNLLGRAYLDDGKPALASVAFYENYQKRPNGDRAAQSLAYLGEALIQLKKPADACKVYDELQKSYGSSLGADLRTMMEKGRARAKCGV